MIDLNQENQRLLDVAQSKTDSPELTAWLTVLSGKLTADQLTAEELNLGQPTIERIQVEEQLDAYIKRAYGSHVSLTGEIVKPDWLKLSGNESEMYARFFAELPNHADITTDLATKGQPDIAGIQTLYQQRNDLADQEQLVGAARAKVRRLVDLRACLVGILRQLGLPGSEIETVAVGV